MVSRLNRNAPLPNALAVRVDEPKAQRAFDSITTALQATIDFLNPWVQAEKWQDLELQTGMSVFADRLQFKKLPDGRVLLQGNAYRASGSSTVVGVLPVGYRPSQRLYFSAVTLDTATYKASRIDIDVDGRILVASGFFDFIMLDGITFEAT